MADRYVSRPSPPHHERRWLLAAGAGLAVFAACAASVVLRGGLTALDPPVARAVAPASGAARESALALATLGGSVLMGALVAATGGLLLLLRRPWGAARVVLLPLASEALVRWLKQVVARPRPPGGALLATDFSFPSGHAANAAVLACLLAWFAIRHSRGRGALLALLGVASGWLGLMALDRLVLDVHHFTDVLGGAGLGVTLAGAGLAASNRLQRRLSEDRTSDFIQ